MAFAVYLGTGAAQGILEPGKEFYAAVTDSEDEAEQAKQTFEAARGVRHAR